MRTQPTLIPAALLLFALASCGGGASTSSSSGGASTSSSGVAKYALSLTGHTEFLLEPLEPSYPAGVTIEVVTSVIYDADLNIYLDGEKIAQEIMESENWRYSFTMPSHDATLDFRIESIEYVPLISLYPWLSDIQESGVKSVRHETGNATVAFGEVEIAYSSDQDDIARVLAISEMVAVAAEQNAVPVGGSYDEYAFYADSGDHAISFYMGTYLYCDGQNYQLMNHLPELNNPDRETFKLVTHSFDCPYCQVLPDGSRSEAKIAEGFSFDEVEFSAEAVEVAPEDVEAPYFAMEVESLGEVFIYAKDLVSLYRAPDQTVRRYYQVEGDHDFGFLFEE
ncbi:MAG: hypothetical protein K6B65_07320 [Bacilli bacterium]|nr:hypothetical protein [Bacilli bacterium]